MLLYEVISELAKNKKGIYTIDGQNMGEFERIEQYFLCCVDVKNEGGASFKRVIMIDNDLEDVEIDLDLDLRVYINKSTEKYEYKKASPEEIETIKAANKDKYLRLNIVFD